MTKVYDATKKTTFQWWRIDNDNIAEDHIEKLNVCAELKIEEMNNKGISSGDLFTVIDYVEYRGAWGVDYKSNF